MAHADPISRVHPKIAGPDGKPLFIDSVALGPRAAKKAVLIITGGAAASAAMTALLQGGVVLPKDAKLVLVHAFDPFSFAGTSQSDPDWSLAMVRAVATEDLARVTDLTVLTLGVPLEGLTGVLTSQLSRAQLAFKQIVAKTDLKTLRKIATDELSRF